jgi:hypothetical protein
MSVVWFVVGLVVIALLALAVRRWWEKDDREHPGRGPGDGPFLPPMSGS